MARRYRKSRRFRRRRLRRFRSRASKALTKVRSLSRKIAGEVKKMDKNAIVPENSFTQLTAAVGTASDIAGSLPDYGYLYPVFTTNNNQSQGLDIGDFVGEQIRAKYLYLGLHLQMPVRPSDASSSATTVQQPLCLRCMVVQDRNYDNELNLAQMVQALFGLSYNGATQSGYMASVDLILAPINPQQPGRFNVIRDFKMYVAPGYRMDYYKKIMLLQKDLLSGGRFYAGTSSMATTGPPGQLSSTWNYMRNNIYVLLFFQSPTLYGANLAGAPDFTVSIQSRLAYYDN